MRQREIELIKMVADGDFRAFPYLYQFSQLVHSEKYFAWLVANRIKGKTFVEYYEKKFNLSFKSFVEYILKDIKENRPLLRSDLK